MFNPNRFNIARKRRKFSKKELAEKLNLSLQTLSEWETGNVTPKFENIKQLSEILNFSVDFFSGKDLPEIPLDAISFRALSKMAAPVRDAAVISCELAIYLNQWFEERFELPKYNKIFNINDTPENIANYVRKVWNITEDCIPDTIYLLEKHGIRVYSIEEHSHDVDALSTIHNGQPFVFLNNQKSAEHSRFDAMHELGHIIMHHGIKEKTRSHEVEANAFAAAMLMPKNSIIQHRYNKAILENYIQLKSIWKVSLTALIHRFAELDLISNWTYRVLMIEARKRGYDKQEPKTIRKETSYILKKLMNILSEDNITIKNIADDLNLSVNDINKLMFDIFPIIFDFNKEKRKLEFND